MTELVERYETKDGDTYRKKRDANGDIYHVRDGSGIISKYAYRGGQSRLLEGTKPTEPDTSTEPDSTGSFGVPEPVEPGSVRITDTDGRIAVADGTGGYKWVDAEQVEIQTAARNAALTQDGAEAEPSDTVELGGERYDTDMVAKGIQRATGKGEPVAHYNGD